MKKDLIIHVMSAIIILVLIVVSYTLLGNVKDLEGELSKSRYIVEDKFVEAAFLKDELQKSHLEQERLLEEILVVNKQLDIDEAMDYHQKVNRQLLDRKRNNYRSILIEQSDILSKGDMSDYYIMYDSDSNAESVIRYYYVPIDYTASLEDELKTIASYVSAYSFADLPVEFKELEVIDGKTIAVINLKDPLDKPDAWSIGFFMGSSMGIITQETLVESFLQKDVVIDDWIDGVHFEFNGERDWITDHDPSICRYTYFRDGTRLEDE